MVAPWPFAQWRLDIMGPFPTAIQQLKFLVVNIDYFNKWVRAEALATIIEKNVWSFVWKNIIYRYGIPKVLVSNNGKQFNNDAFRNFCSQLGKRITTHHLPTLRPMNKLRSLIDPYSKSSRLGSRGQRYMAEGIAKHLMSIQDNGKDTYRRDTILTSIWKRSSHSGWSRTHKLQSRKPWRG